MRGNLYWNGSAWVKWDGLNATLTSVGSDSIDVNIIGGSSAGTEYTDGDTDATPTGSVAMGTDGSEIYAMTTDADGHLQVDVLTGGGGGTQYTEGDTDATITGTAILWEDAANTLVTVNSSKPLPVDIKNASVTVDGTVTADTELPAAAALDDNMATPTTPLVGACLMAYDGSGWDRLTGSAATGLNIAAPNGVRLVDAGGDNVTDDATDTVKVSDGGGALTVDGTVTANLSATDNAVLDNIDADTSAIQTAVQIMDDWDESDRAKVNPIVGQAGVAGDSGTVGATTQRVVLATDVGLPAGTNAIGKLSANSGVDIGDVDVTSIAAGTNAIGNVGMTPRTSGGLLIKNCTSGDGSTALTNSAQEIKASAGQLFGWYIFNPNSVTAWVIIYNTAAASVTVGTTNPAMVLGIPAGAAANVVNPMGIEFTNAGWSAAAVMTAANGNTAPTIALDANFLYI